MVMQGTWWRLGGEFRLVWPENGLISTLALGLYLVILATLLVRRQRELHPWRRRQTLLLAGLFLLTLLLNLSLILPINGLSQLLTHFPGQAAPASVPLLGSVAPVLAGAWLGWIPAVGLALLAGLLQAGWGGGNSLHAFGLVALVGSLTILIRQDYRGELARWLRQPIVASLIGVITGLLFIVPALLADLPAGDGQMQYVEVLIPLTIRSLAILFIQGLSAGALLQLADWLWPAARPVPAGRSVPTYETHLSQRLVLFFIPMAAAGIIGICTLVILVTDSTMRELVEMQMKRDADSAASLVPEFFLTGQTLVQKFAADAPLRSSDPKAVLDQLESDLRTVAFFEQLALVTPDGQTLASYPVDLPTSTLEQAEQQVLSMTVTSGAPIQTQVYSGPRGSSITFMAPVVDPAKHTTQAILLGRTTLTMNPVLKRALTSLQDTFGAGRGFLVDQRGVIVAHPDAGWVLKSWTLDTSPNRLPPAGQFSDDTAPTGERLRVWEQPVRGQPWSVVLTVPYAVVLLRTLRLATPILLTLALGGVAASAGMWVLGNRLTRPLKKLSVAADRYAAGNLDWPVQVAGHDEVGRLGVAFEHMRRSLKARLEELSLLLQISQHAATSLELEQSLPPILAGARQAAGASGARIVLRNENGRPGTAVADGPAAQAMAALDEQVMGLMRSERLLRLENLIRARTVIDPSPANGAVKALLALPLRNQGRLVGMLWVGYAEPHAFSASELSFQTTLAGQAAAVIEKARLFQAAEGGRRRLEAILTSTTDPVIVTDQADRLLLLNPAAEAAFGLQAAKALRRPVAESLTDPGLLLLLTGQSAGPTTEVRLADGRTLYASVSTIQGEEGSSLGRVAVLRDITTLKELDQLKSDFVQTVSHDLRGPLTFMRGYAGMLSMVGSLTARQQDFADKIIAGIEQMTALIDKLLDLNRIEAGIGLVEEPCSIQALVRDAVESFQVQAMAKELDLRAEISDTIPIYWGDPTLLRQAVANLVENAIKYTEKGEVVVRARQDPEGLIITVQDTGSGIAPADQSRMFEKFYRVRRKDSAQVQGSGLGLAIVKSIAERHGGHVWVESRVGEGSTFYILLPTQRPEMVGIELDGKRNRYG